MHGFSIRHAAQVVIANRPWVENPSHKEGQASDNPSITASG
jgi:hypothetical protein